MKVYLYEHPQTMCALCGSLMDYIRKEQREGSLFPFSLYVRCLNKDCPQFEQFVSMMPHQEDGVDRDQVR